MRILLIHNFYGSEAPSGENKVVEMEWKMLKTHGHTVRLFSRQSDEIRRQGSWGKLKGALSTVWNPWIAHAVRKEVEAFKPDIVHVHNTFPLISNAIFGAIRHRSKIVVTLHNYRTVCPAGIPMRAGKVCTLCIEQRSSLPALKYGCYRNSRLATLPLALSVGLHRWLKTWQRDVDAIIVLSDFQKKMMVSAGFPEKKIFVKGNFCATFPDLLPGTKDDTCVFVGRLSSEKGIRTLINAWKLWGDDAPVLKIIGDGSLRRELEEVARDQNIEFLGQCETDVTHNEIEKGKLLILPSECYETFGMVVVEGYAHATPVAVSDLGALPSIVKAGVTGVIFPPGDAEQLFKVVSRLWNDRPMLSAMGHNARRTYEENYTESANYVRLMDIYVQLHASG